MAKKQITMYSESQRQMTALGQRLKDARLRRRFSKEVVCLRAQISRPTLDKIETGDPSAAFGNYVQVLSVLGLERDLGHVALKDELGRQLQDESLPLRIRAPKRKKISRPERLIAIGDIHGQLDKLNNLLNQIEPSDRDQFVFLGDYIDRGPASCGVIDRLIDFQSEFPEAVFLRGNHEQMMLDALQEHHPERLPEYWSPLESVFGDRGNFEVWTQNGAWETLSSYGVLKDKLASLFECWENIPQAHINFLLGARLYHRQAGFLFVHAGADEQQTLEDQAEVLLWERHAPPGTKEIHVVGHVPCPESKPYFEEKRYNLDTGAGYGRFLTACDVLTKKYWQSE
jgi:serine/threonine protein phosphatase 1